MLPDSIVLIRVKNGWIAFIRYTNSFFDKDVACSTRYELDRKVSYLVRRTEVSTRG